MEQTREKTTTVLGRLRDLGLGNPDGIPSYLANASDEELQAVAERDSDRLVVPDDLTATACIDGRRTKQNADGSEAVTRLRRVGGSASNAGAAFNAEASIMETISEDDSLEAITDMVDAQVGYRSAHLGGCGGANGEIADNVAISEKPAIMDATKVFLSIPAVADYFGIEEVKRDMSQEACDELYARVQRNAAKTVEFLKAKGWDGQAYVDRVRAKNPENVEDIEVDHHDEEFHGHREPKLTIIIGGLTMPLDDDGFTWNLKATKQFAESMAGQRGREGYLQAVIADVAKHMAVADRLPSDETPVILQQA